MHSHDRQHRVGGVGFTHHADDRAGDQVRQNYPVVAQSWARELVRGTDALVIAETFLERDATLARARGN